MEKQEQGTQETKMKDGQQGSHYETTGPLVAVTLYMMKDCALAALVRVKVCKTSWQDSRRVRQPIRDLVFLSDGKLC